MTVPNENNEIQYVLTSATQNLPTNFYFLETDDLEVIRTDQSTPPVDTTLTEGSNYTVNLPASVGGNGSIDMIGGTIGDTITIIRCPERTQDVDYIENDRFSAKITEKALDKLTMLIQKITSALFGSGSKNGRYIHYPKTELSTSPELPSLSDRKASGAGTLFGFKGTDGSPEPVSKGTLGATLTLSNASDLGRPSSSAVNGATQAAINTNFENTWTGVGGLDSDGAYIAKSGTNFIDGNSSLNEDITDLDTNVNLAKADITNINNSVTTLQSSVSNLNTFATSFAGEISAWVSFNGATGTATASGGCTVARNTVGNYTVTLTSSIASSAYVVLITTDSDNSAQMYNCYINGKSPSSFNIRCVNDSATALDPTIVDVAVISSRVGV